MDFLFCLPRKLTKLSVTGRQPRISSSVRAPPCQYYPHLFDVLSQVVFLTEFLLAEVAPVGDVPGNVSRLVIPEPCRSLERLTAVSARQAVILGQPAHRQITDCDGGGNVEYGPTLGLFRVDEFSEVAIERKFRPIIIRKTSLCDALDMIQQGIFRALTSTSVVSSRSVAIPSSMGVATTGDAGNMSPVTFG